MNNLSTFFGFFGVDLEERFEFLQELISNNLAIRRILESVLCSNAFFNAAPTLCLPSLTRQVYKLFQYL